MLFRHGFNFDDANKLTTLNLLKIKHFEIKAMTSTFLFTTSRTKFFMGRKLF